MPKAKGSAHSQLADDEQKIPVFMRQYWINGELMGEAYKIMIAAKKLTRNFMTATSAARAFPREQSDIMRVENGRQVLDLQRIEVVNSKVDSLIVLNNKLNEEWLLKGLNCARNVILADGGANRFYETPFRHWGNVRSIVGDLDSLDPDVGRFYKSRGVELSQVWNQDTNDFEKSVGKSMIQGWNNILCFGAFGGRMDHSLGVMHYAMKLAEEHPKLNMVLFGKTNFMYYLKPNVTHEIRISNHINKMCCGLVPFGKVDHIETDGFKWNLGTSHCKSSLQWGDFISTSNEIVEDRATVRSSQGLFAIFHFREAPKQHQF